VSASTGAGLAELTELIAARAQDAVGEIGVTAVPTNARHRLLLSDAIAHLTRFCDGEPSALELQAEDLRLAAHALGRLTGRIDPEDVLGAVFGRFCIGK
jgi:tRNA modification GTPase